MMGWMLAAEAPKDQIQSCIDARTGSAVCLRIYIWFRMIILSQEHIVVLSEFQTSKASTNRVHNQNLFFDDPSFPMTSQTKHLQLHSTILKLWSVEASTGTSQGQNLLGYVNLHGHRQPQEGTLLRDRKMARWPVGKIYKNQENKRKFIGSTEYDSQTYWESL